jgi:hypothetical protein
MKGLVPHRWRRVWAVTRWVAVASALPLIWACNARTLEAPVPNPVSVVNNTFQASLNREIDILFMVDNSQSMLPLQAKLIAQFPVFMNVLKMVPAGNGAGTALPDIHVAVVSSDTGPGQFDLPAYHCKFTGDKGEFQNTPRGTCLASPFKNPTDTFLSASMNQGVTNYNGDISDAFTCIAALGDQGCGFEGQLKSIRWALDSMNGPAANDGTNVGFLRPEAFLAVILITNEDDCSVPDDSDLIDPNQTTMASKYGPLWSWRCNEFGHLCNINGTLQPPPRGPSTNLQGCISNDTPSGKLTYVSDEIAFLKGLKTDPNQVFVAAITGPATPYTVDMIMQGNDTELHPNVRHSCPIPFNDGAEYADPSVRIQQWVEAFHDHGLLETICADSFAPALLQISTELSKLLGAQCMTNDLVDMDPNMQGLQPECQVIDQYTQNNTMFKNPVQSCLVTNDAPPCWSLDTPNPNAMPPENCPANSLVLHVKRGTDPLPNGLSTSVSCSRCTGAPMQAGCP